MNYAEYISYHCRGDAGVEERVVSNITKELKLDVWDSFRLIYFYSITYSITSALAILDNIEIDKSSLRFRTDRRWVRIGDRYQKLISELNKDKMFGLMRCRTTTEAYDEVKKWYYFSRYSAFLFLEIYMAAFKPLWTDDLRFVWEEKENYTKGAVIVTNSTDRRVLDSFLNKAKKDTKDNCFAIETSLCAVEKIRKGTRYDGFYRERLLKEIKGSKYEALIMRCL